LYITSIIHQQLWWHKVEQKLHLEAHEQKRFNTTSLDYSSYTYFQKAIRNVKSKSNWKVPVQFINKRMWAKESSSLELNTILSLEGLQLVLEFYPTIALKGPIPKRWDEIIVFSSMPPVLQDGSSKSFQKKLRKDLETAGCLVFSIAMEPLCLILSGTCLWLINLMHFTFLPRFHRLCWYPIPLISSENSWLPTG
jgi:hypothetical protein